MRYMVINELHPPLDGQNHPRFSFRRINGSVCNSTSLLEWLAQLIASLVALEVAMLVLTIPSPQPIPESYLCGLDWSATTSKSPAGDMWLDEIIIDKTDYLRGVGLGANPLKMVRGKLSQNAGTAKLHNSLYGSSLAGNQPRRRIRSTSSRTAAAAFVISVLRRIDRRRGRRQRVNLDLHPHARIDRAIAGGVRRIVDEEAACRATPGASPAAATARSPARSP